MTTTTLKTMAAAARSATLQRQRGGTLLGLILGALLGLGAALAVAVYITKVPVPFVNKSQPRAADSDAAEAKKNKDWNPNAPLAGKNPARPAQDPADPGVSGAPAPVLPPVATKPGMPAAVGPATAAAPVVPKAKGPASADPLGDLAASKAKPKPDAAQIAAQNASQTAAAAPVANAALTAPGADPFAYFIQAGAFRTPEDAEQQRAKLSLMGFQARVSEREQAGRTVYRVRLGPFNQKDEADRTKEKLESNAVETALVRVQR